MKNQSPNEPTTEKKVFDRTVCFTCFGDYVDTLDTIAEQSGPEIAYAAFEILADYCLYGIEPDPETNPWGLVWPIVERRARLSMNNRRRGFGTPDTELAERVREYAAKHPEATQQQIAEAAGCHRNTVRKFLRDGAAYSGSSPGLDRSPCSSPYIGHDSYSSRVQTPFPPTALSSSSRLSAAKPTKEFSPAVSVQTTREGAEV